MFPALDLRQRSRERLCQTHGETRGKRGRGTGEDLETGRRERGSRRWGDRRRQREDGEKGCEEKGVARTFGASLPAPSPSGQRRRPAIRPAGGRWPGAHNAAEECGTWD